MKDRVIEYLKNMNIRKLLFSLLFIFCILNAYYVYYTRICIAGLSSLCNYQKLFILIGFFISILMIVSYIFRDRLFSSKYLCKTIFVLLIAFGTTMSILIPLGNCPDETSHMNTAYYYSNKILGIKDSKSGLTMRKCDAEEFKVNGVTYTEMIQYISKFKESANNTELIETNRQPLGVKMYSYTYIPQAIGISIGRILNLNTISVFLLGKFFNLLIYSLLVVFALKIMPKYKSVLIFSAFLPMALQQATSLSYDAMVNGLGLCVTAITFKLFENMNISKKEKIVYSIICILLFFTKQYAYIALATLPLIYYIFDQLRRKYKFNKENILKLLLYIIPICLLFYIILCLTIGTSLTTASPLYFALHPLTFINKINLSLIRWSIYYFRTLFTGGFGTDELQAPEWINMAYFALFIYMIFGGTLNQAKDKFKRIFIFCVCFITLYGLVYTFQNNTPLEWGYIWGIQGRYFIPLLALFMYSISKKGFFSDSESMTLINVQLFLCYITIFEVFYLRTVI